MTHAGDVAEHPATRETGRTDRRRRAGREPGMSRPAACVALAVAVLLAGGGSATATPALPRMADFTVHVEGVQRTAWEHHHLSEGGCDVSIDGSGSETVRFRSGKLRVRAYATPAGVQLSGLRGEPLLRLSGTVTRQGAELVGPGEVCSFGDGTGEPAPVPADCGRRPVRSTAAIGFAVRPSDLVMLVPGVDLPSDPFANCPTGASEQYPQLLAYDDAGRRIGRRLPVRDLFDYGQHVVIARGERTQRGGERFATTSIRWTATFTRLRPAD